MDVALRKIAIGLTVLPVVCLPTAGFGQASPGPDGRLVAIEANAASTCLKPIQQGESDFGNYGGFRNTCNFTVEYTYCVQNPKAGSWGDSNPCQSGRRTGNVEGIGPNGRSAAHIYGGTRVHWFACAQANTSKEGPAGIWGDVVFDGTQLKGRCRYDRFQAAAAVPKAMPRTNPTATAATPSSAGSLAPDQVAKAGRSGSEAWNRGDYATAVQQWRIAADAGDSVSAYNLGVAYTRGNGVQFDSAQADVWFGKAAQAGHKGAAYQYGASLFRKGRYAEARQWLEKAVAGGDPNAQFLLGALLVNGMGGPVDRIRGRNLIAQAAAQGHLKAKETLARLDGTAPPKPGQVPPKSTPTAARPGGTGDPIWAACEGAIMAWLRIQNDTSPSRVQQVREAWSFPKMSESWRSAPDSELQFHINRWNEAIADAPRQYVNVQIRQGFVIATRAQICQMEAYMSARRTRK